MIRNKLNWVLFFLAFAIAPFHLFSDSLFLLQLSDSEQARPYIENPAFEVHYYCDDFLIATLDFTPKEEHILLDSNPWQADISYYIVYASPEEAAAYQIRWADRMELLYEGNFLMIVSTNEVVHGQLEPARNDGMVRIFRQKARIPSSKLNYTPATRNPDPFIQELIDQVDYNNITPIVQHLQDYGTRDAYHANSVLAQNWLKEQFESYDLSVELMPFNMPGGTPSDNVIATLPGTKYPDEYVICGSHFDSYSYSGLAPGADDNASGTAGVLEIARILSQYEFDRTLVFCSFSGEEYGLYGSAAYAARCAQQGMDIHGYVNLDMTAYLKPGNTVMKSTLIFPSSAQELAEFYMDICSTYLPEFVVAPGTLSGGDSDHTSFNNNGYMGIYPFESVPDYSPYIHTPDDVIGLSYNNEEQAEVFTKAALASVATMANRLLPPRGLMALAGDQQVELDWTELFGAASYNIYRDNDIIDNVSTNSFIDTEVENGEQYSYYVTAIYEDTGLESDPSNTVTVIPMPPLVLPYAMDFESGAPYWEFSDNWGLATTQSHSPSHSITESPNGNYANSETSFAYLRPFSLNMGFTTAEVSFWTRYDIESNYDYMYFEISTNGQSWIQIASFTGAQNTWQQKTYSLNSYLGQDWVQLRFRFKSDYMVSKDGMYIDDFALNTTGGLLHFSAALSEGWNSLSSYIEPVDPELSKIFEPLSEKLVAVQSATGLFYPQQGINTIGNWDNSSGYKVKMNSPGSLMIQGAQLVDGSLPIAAGWNLIPVLSACPITLQELISTHSDKVEFVRNISASQIYWPLNEISDLEQLLPGNSYMLKSSAAFTLNFPECKAATPAKLAPDVTVTSSLHTIGFAAGSLDFAESGDQIIAFNNDGFAAGILEINNPMQPAYIAIYGNDSLSTVVDGFLPEQLMQLKWLPAQTQEYHDLTVTYDEAMPNKELFAYEGLSRITHIEPDMVGIAEKSMALNVFPNPVHDLLHIQMDTHKIKAIELLNMEGVCLMQFDENSISSELDVAPLSVGLYVLRIYTEEGIQHIRFVKR